MSVEYTPPSAKQMFILKWSFDPKWKNKNAFIADGSIRTGKTMWMSQAFIYWAMSHFDGMDFIIAGKTIASLKRNVIKPLENYLRPRGYNIIERQSDNKMIINYGGVTNTFYWFGGKDESSQDLVQGLTAAGCYFDEVALMPESFVNQATGRCLSVEGHKYWFNCNPSNPYHWFKRHWIDDLKSKKAIRLRFSMNDNPILTQQMIDDASAMYSGAFYKRFILGEWVSADGLVYSNFDEETMISDVPDGVNITTYIVSADYGIYHPMVFILWGKGTDGIWYALDTYYYDGEEHQLQKTDEQYADDFVHFLHGIKPQGIIMDPSASSMIKALQMRGYKVVKANNDVNNGIRVTQLRMDDGSIKFTNKMQPLFKELKTYSWDDKAAEKGKDQVIKKFDHECDAMRYFCMKVLRPKDNKTNGVQMYKDF